MNNEKSEKHEGAAAKPWPKRTDTDKPSAGVPARIAPGRTSPNDVNEAPLATLAKDRSVASPEDRGKILALMKAPTASLVYSINSVPRSFLHLLKALPQHFTGALAIVPRSFVRLLSARKVQLAELAKEMEIRWGISGAEARAEFTVTLLSFGERKISTIAAVLALNPKLRLSEAKALVEMAPTPISERTSLSSALAIARRLEEGGAEVEVR